MHAVQPQDPVPSRGGLSAAVVPGRDGGELGGREVGVITWGEYGEGWESYNSLGSK